MILLTIFTAFVHQTTTLQVTHVSDCGTARGCWKLPSGCVGEECSAVVTWKHQGRAMMVEVESKLSVGASGSWVAVGLSRDEQMGNDTVFECHFTSAGEGAVHLSHNVQTSNVMLPAATEKLLKDSYAEMVDGRALCGAEWILDKTVVEASEKKMIHTISSGKYTLMLATGDLDTSGEKKIHVLSGVGAPWKSAETIRFCHHCSTAFKIVDESLVKKKRV